MRITIGSEFFDVVLRCHDCRGLVRIQNSDSRISAISSSCAPSRRAARTDSFSKAISGAIKSIAHKLLNSFLVMVWFGLVI